MRSRFYIILLPVFATLFYINYKDDNTIAFSNSPHSAYFIKRAAQNNALNVINLKKGNNDDIIKKIRIKAWEKVFAAKITSTPFIDFNICPVMLPDYYISNEHICSRFFSLAYLRSPPTIQ